MHIVHGHYGNIDEWVKLFCYAYNKLSLISTYHQNRGVVNEAIILRFKITSMYPIYIPNIITRPLRPTFSGIQLQDG